jgi:hypothetical protein
MSVPQFKELVLAKIEQAINEEASFLVEQTGADYGMMRQRQGTIAGLRQAREIIQQQYREGNG